MDQSDRRTKIAAVVGVVALAALLLTSWRAVVAVLDEHAYTTAAGCATVPGAGAGAGYADCRREVPGTVLAVTETGGRAADFRLDVATDAGRFAVRFPGDNAVLGYAADGDPVTLTLWRGQVVEVGGRGGSAQTGAAPQARFASMLGGALLSLGIADYALFLAALPGLARRYGFGRLVGREATGAHVPTRTFLVVLASIGGLVPLLTGTVQLAGQAQDTGVHLVAGGIALLLVLALSTWTAAVARRNRRGATHRAAADADTDAVAEGGVPGAGAADGPAPAVAAPEAGSGPRARSSRPSPFLLLLRLRSVLRRRLGLRPPRAVLPHLPRPAFERTFWVTWLMPLLAGAGIAIAFLTTGQALAAHAYRTAPACVGQVLTPQCRGVVPMVVTGLRTPAGAGRPAVALTTTDGGINTWAVFDAGPLSRQASRLQRTGTPLPVHVWQRRILGVDLDGATDWAADSPPDAGLGLVALATVLGLFLLLNRVRARLRNLSRSTSLRRLLLEDLGQAGVAALGLWLLVAGSLWALPLILAAPVWSLRAVRAAWLRELAHGYLPVLPGRTERDRERCEGGLSERLAAFADAPLLLEPRDQAAELRVNRFRLGPETLDDPAAPELPALLAQWSRAARERIAAAGHEGPAACFAYVPVREAALYCGVTSRTRAELLGGPVRPVDSPAELVAHWHECVAAERAAAARDDEDQDDDQDDDGDDDDWDDEDAGRYDEPTPPRVAVAWLVELA